MDPDEYEYLEKTTEEHLAKTSVKDSNGSAGGTGYKRRREGTPDGGRDRHRRSRSGSDSRDRHRDREREHRHRSGSRDDRERVHRHRSGSRDDREREHRHRSGSRDDRVREREHRHRSGSRDDREREHRHRSGSREHRHRSGSRDDRGHRSSGERRERERRLEEYDRGRESREREREHEARRQKNEKIEPEADPERDQRTVFAYQLPLKADERDVYEFFSKAGKVRDVRLIMDRNTRRSKGVGYIEFYDVMSVPLAITLSNQTIRGQPVMVKPSEAEKNLVPSSSAAAFNGPYTGGGRRLYVGNLHFSITEEQVKQVFESFGPVELVQMPRDTEGGPCKGYGFIQFARLEDAKAALHLNGQIELAGRKLKVSSVTEQSGASDVGATAIDFEDDDGGGLSLNASSRAMLMAKLDRTGTASSTLTAAAPAAVSATAGIALPAGVPTSLVVPGSAAASLAAPLVNIVAGVPTSLVLPGSAAVSLAAPLVNIGHPTECLLLTNMFDPTTETEPDFDLDIEEDVHEECSKYGVLKHIFVDKNSAGHVYLRFGNVASAVAAQRNLHGRWFARKAITATFMVASFQFTP